MMSMSKNQDLDAYPQANGGLEPGMAMNQDPDAYPQANGGLEPGMAMSKDPTVFPQANGGLEPGKTFSLPSDARTTPRHGVAPLPSGERSSISWRFLSKFGGQDSTRYKYPKAP